MNSTEVSSSANCSFSVQKSPLARIEVFLFLTFLLLLFLLPIRMVRRRYNSGLLKGFALGASAAITLLIPYTYGLMIGLNFKNHLTSLWASFLLYVFANAPNILKVKERQSFLGSWMKMILYVCYFTSVVVVYPSNSTVIQGCLLLILAGSLVKYGETAPASTALSTARADFNLPSNSDGQGVDDALVDTTRPAGSNDPWLRCKYIFYPNYPFGDREITIQEIWGCEEAGCILSSSSSSDDLKSSCLSLALFWKLKSRFAGCSSYKSSHQEKAWNLVRNWLLDREIRENSCPFRVIEIELALLYDFLYNSSRLFFAPILGVTLALTKHLCYLVGISLGAVVLKMYDPKEGTARIEYHKQDVDVLITWIVIVATILLELVHIIILLSSWWSKMILFRTYLLRGSWKKKNMWDRCIRKAAEIILCPSRGGGGGELFKPWQRQLGQYALLDSYSYMQHRPIISFAFMTGNRFVSPGREKSKNASLTNEIKKAVIQALLDRGPQLTNGIATLQASDELPPETKRKLAWACTQLGTDAELVLVWHIATSLCKINLDQLPSGPCDYCIDDVQVATSLSNYCAYLVAFAPSMLPGHVATTEFTCSLAIDEAYKRLKNCATQKSDIYQELMKITVKDGVDIEYDDPHSQRDSATILQQGAILGKALVAEIVDLRIRWKVLACLWAEMILYLAPNAHNEWDHAERLEDGGEFITYCWALLFHAGIVDRDSFNNKIRDAESDPLELHQV